MFLHTAAHSCQTIQALVDETFAFKNAEGHHVTVPVLTQLDWLQLHACHLLNCGWGELGSIQELSWRAAGAFLFAQCPFTKLDTNTVATWDMQFLMELAVIFLLIP